MSATERATPLSPETAPTTERPGTAPHVGVVPGPIEPQEDQKNLKTELQKQQEYMAKQATERRVPDIVQGEQFIAGMRKLGYRSTGNALDELLDNSLEAGATRCMIAFGYTGKSNNKPTELAVIDNGIGMPKELIQHAVVWGGTHRHDSRDFFGRFGFGLPSASMSIGKRFEVYSKQEGEAWHMVPIDLEEIVANDPAYRSADNRVVPPEPVQMDPPAWVVADAEGRMDFGRAGTGTIVVIKKIDNLDYKTTDALRNALMIHFGTTYRNFLDQMGIWVDGVEVGVVDPLFLTPTGRFYDESNGKVAVPLPELEVPVEVERNGQKIKASITVRFSYLPYGYAKSPEGPLLKGRLGVMKDNLGIICMRQGRQIEVLTSRCPWTKFQNNDTHCRIEVNFPAVLDEYFDVPTNKQQVVPAEHIWTVLKNAGVYAALQEMRKRYILDKAQSDAEKEQESAGGAILASEAAMGEVAKTLTNKPQSPRRQKEGTETLEKRVRERVAEFGVTQDEARAEVQAELDSRKYQIKYESLPEGPFYTCRPVGGALELVINTAHPFFTDLYSAPGTDARSRAGMECLLFVLAVREVEVGDEMQDIYKQERMHWSSMFGRVLRVLSDQFSNIVDSQNMSDQMNEEEELAASAASDE
jgi:hypothetical protein